MIAKIQAYQYKMFAEGKRNMLIILQWLDASGKDGVVRYIFSGMNPLWTKATSFRVPTKEEMSHDFLWRIHKKTPANGEVMIFNRSHYEDILVPTVEKLLDKKTINKRYDHINQFENILQENGTVIVKFYLHISKNKQKEKLNERLTDPTKYWKHKIGDWDTRDNYNDYLNVYEDIFAKCDQPERHIIAADQNWYKIYQISKVLLKTFEEMELRWPKLSPDQETAYLRAKAELLQRDEQEKDAKEKAKELEKDKKIEAKIAKKQEEKLAKEKAREAKKLAKKKKKEAKKLAKIKKEEAELKAKEDEKLAQLKAKELKQKAKVGINITPKKPQISTKKPTISKKPQVKKPRSTSKSLSAK